VKNLIPQPSEGRVRALFCEYKDQSKKRLPNQSKSILSQVGQNSIFGDYN
jgi:hypothetical protein